MWFLFQECPGYDTIQSDGEAPVVLEIRGMWSTPSLPSLTGPFWPGVVAPDRVLSMGQIRLFELDSNTWSHLTLWKTMSSGSFKNVITKMCLEVLYILYKQDLAFNNLQWLICHKTKPTDFPPIAQSHAWPLQKMLYPLNIPYKECLRYQAIKLTPLIRYCLMGKAPWGPGNQLTMAYLEAWSAGAVEYTDCISAEG